METQNHLSPFDQLKADITLYVAPAKQITVSDKETQSKALASTKEVVSWKKRVEEKRKELVAPLLERQREINDYAKALTDPLVEAESHLKKQLITWDQKLEAERQAELKRIQEEARKREEEARKEALKAKEEAEALAMFGDGNEATRQSLVADAEAERKQTQIAKEAKKEEKAALDNKVSGIRTIWKFEVTDASKVPAQFMIVDESAIGKAVRGGTREIPGVRIFEEKTLGVR